MTDTDKTLEELEAEMDAAWAVYEAAHDAYYKTWNAYRKAKAQEKSDD